MSLVRVHSWRLVWASPSSPVLGPDGALYISRGITAGGGEVIPFEQ